MLKITIKYETKDELTAFLKTLPRDTKCKLPKTQKGQYKRCYIDLNYNIQTAGNRVI